MKIIEIKNNEYGKLLESTDYDIIDMLIEDARFYSCDETNDYYILTSMLDMNEIKPYVLAKNVQYTDGELNDITIDDIDCFR